MNIDKRKLSVDVPSYYQWSIFVPVDMTMSCMLGFLAVALQREINQNQDEDTHGVRKVF